MARNKGGFVFASNFEVKLQGLLDPRGGVTNKADLINKETFPYDGDVIYMQEGMLVTVSSTQEVYMLVSLANILAEDYSGWKRIDAGAAQALEVVDNLESDSATAALSANQGKVLKAEIDAVSNKLTGVYSYKGSKATYAELPTDAAVGDVWNVEEAYDGHAAGTNWAWTGEEWDALAGSIDLSAYYTSAQVDAAIKVEADRAVAKEVELLEAIEANETAIGNNTADITKNTSDISSISTQISEINTLLTTKVDKEEGKSLVADEKIALIDTNASDIEALETKVTSLESTDTSLAARISTLEGMISGGEIDGSSLVEVVAGHTTEITNIQTTVSGLTTDLSELEARVDDHETRLTAVEGMLAWKEI